MSRWPRVVVEAQGKQPAGGGDKGRQALVMRTGLLRQFAVLSRTNRDPRRIEHSVTLYVLDLTRADPVRLRTHR